MLGFGLSFFCLGGLAAILSIIGLVRINRTGDRGRGLAIAGLVISALWVLTMTGPVLRATNDAMAKARLTRLTTSTTIDLRDANGRITRAGQIPITSLVPGDCLAQVPHGTVGLVDAIPCDQPHVAQTMATFDLSDPSYPGRDQIRATARSGCYKRLTDDVTQQIADGLLDTEVYDPSPTGWAHGNRKVQCLVVGLDDPLTGTIPLN